MISHSAARAIGWQFRRRHRLGVIGLTVYFGVLGAIKLIVLSAGSAIRLDSPESFGFVVVVPLAATFTYLLAVFSFGLSGDLAARQSIFPSRMFTLPVTSAALAGWPMMYGTVMMAILWAATRLFALWPSDVTVPTLWPALLAASLLAWTQALTWTAYPVVGLRVIVTVLWLATIDAVVLLALRYQRSEPFMVGFLAPQVPLAFVVAHRAVASARRGDVPDWSGVRSKFGSLTARFPRVRRTLASSEAAQSWYEWRRFGRSLPALIGFVLPFELCLLRIVRDAPPLTTTVLAGILLTPIFLATFVGATVAEANPGAADQLELPPFVAVRPLSDSDLIAAKLRAAIRSTLCAWLLVLLGLAAGLAWAGTGAAVLDRARRLARVIGAPRVIVLAALVLAGLVLWTWRQLAQRMYVGLAGRGWLAKGHVFATLAVLFLLGPAIQLVIDDDSLRGALWDALPILLAALVCIKLVAGSWIAVRLHRRCLVTNKALLAAAGLWCGAVVLLYAALAWFIGTPYVPRSLVMLVAMLAIPWARVSAAPLALARNRHR